MLHQLNDTSVKVHTCLSITDSSPKATFHAVLKVAVVERFDCRQYQIYDEATKG